MVNLMKNVTLFKKSDYSHVIEVVINVIPGVRIIDLI